MIDTPFDRNAVVRFVRTQIYPRKGLADQVMYDLATTILSGSLRPGDTLPNETELATRLGISRNSVREAIKVLASKGLLESRPKTGTRVRSEEHWNYLDADVLGWKCAGKPDLAFVREVFEMRLLFEPAAAELAATRRSDKKMELLSAALQQLIRATDYDTFVPADQSFHLLILDMSQNRLFVQMQGVIKAALGLSYTARAETAGALWDTLPMHEAVHDAIRDGHGGAAAAASRELIEATAREVELFYKRMSKRSGSAKHRFKRVKLS